MNKRNTIQKETVARIVKEACDHPTAEMIFEKAKVELPNISLGTVYRILKDMAHEGELREVVCKDAPSRFDKTMMEHAHFTCVQCGGVDDVFINTDKVGKDIVDFGGKVVFETQIMFRGLCEECAKKVKNADTAK